MFRPNWVVCYQTGIFWVVFVCVSPQDSTVSKWASYYICNISQPIIRTQLIKTERHVGEVEQLDPGINLIA